MYKNEQVHKSVVMLKLTFGKASNDCGTQTVTALKNNYIDQADKVGMLRTKLVMNQVCCDLILRIKRIKDQPWNSAVLCLMVYLRGVS